jgi:hypothetical protein
MDSTPNAKRVLVLSDSEPFFEATGIPTAVESEGMLHLAGHTGDTSGGGFSLDPAEPIGPNERAPISNS